MPRKSSHVYVDFSDGYVVKTMTLRKLCGWARARSARVFTQDGWPVINGVEQNLSRVLSQSGTVTDGERVLATWERKA